MKIYTRIIKYTEVILIVFVWLVLILTPVLFREDYDKPLWRSLNNQFLILFPLSILFLVNRFILVPKLLFRGRLSLFISAVFGTILVLTIGSYLFDTYVKPPPPPLDIVRETEEKPAKSPGFFHNRDTTRPDRPIPPPRQPRPMPPFANFLILSVLIVGFDTGLKSGLRWIESENDKMRLEKENVANQLMLLRNQVSPHFFMNTLNNIHALIDINREEAKEAIIKLSVMMRYLLYETQTDKTSLKKEVEFLESYVNLMKLRFNDKVRIALNLPVVIPERSLPPLLFTSIIENAFKHGISYKDESFIIIDMVFDDDRFLLMVKNSKTAMSDREELSGIGLENTRKRLDLLYGNNYHMEIINNQDLFTVNLSIPL